LKEIRSQHLSDFETQQSKYDNGDRIDAMANTWLAVAHSQINHVYIDSYRVQLWLS